MLDLIEVRTVQIELSLSGAHGHVAWGRLQVPFKLDRKGHVIGKRSITVWMQHGIVIGCGDVDQSLCECATLLIGLAAVKNQKRWYRDLWRTIGAISHSDMCQGSGQCLSTRRCQTRCGSVVR
ncbi:hypothetical protein G6F68_017248 [Rhizopus microsporus]|nr:hypothetical protein G6F68_017248 [Rhizopus microsporus]